MQVRLKINQHQNQLKSKLRAHMFNLRNSILSQDQCLVQSKFKRSKLQDKHPKVSNKIWIRAKNLRTSMGMITCWRTNSIWLVGMNLISWKQKKITLIKYWILTQIKVMTHQTYQNKRKKQKNTKYNIMCKVMIWALD